MSVAGKVQTGLLLKEAKLKLRNIPGAGITGLQTGKLSIRQVVKM